MSTDRHCTADPSPVTFMSLHPELRLLIYKASGIKNLLGKPSFLGWKPEQRSEWETEWWNRNVHVLEVRNLRQSCTSIRDEIDDQICRMQHWRFRYESLANATQLPSPPSFFGHIDINFYPYKSQTFVQQLIKLLQVLQKLNYTKTLKILIATETGWNLSRYFSIPRTGDTRQNLYQPFQTYVATIGLEYVTLQCSHRGTLSSSNQRAAKQFNLSIADTLEEATINGGADFKMEHFKTVGYCSLLRT